MPIYNYKCNKCGYIFEEFASRMSEEIHCPKCEQTAIRINHFQGQRLKSVDYIPPPMATRKFGEERPSPHIRKKWQ
jgi:putative FmdB family regulatory protein